jgi:hypothetical protein
MPLLWSAVNRIVWVADVGIGLQCAVRSMREGAGVEASGSPRG